MSSPPIDRDLIDRDLVRADLRRAAGHWDRGGPDRLDAAVDAAMDSFDGRDGVERARFCVVTKGPHLDDPLSLACVAARLTAFGVTIHAVRRIDDQGTRVAQSLYPRAARYFHHGPTLPVLWDRLARRYDTDDFTAIFGRRYDPSLVVAGDRAIGDNKLSAAEFIRIWESGRTAVTRETLTRDFGPVPAKYVLDGAESYDWFRGALPIGISRVASGMTAFATRDPRLYDGAPVIVVNGHVPGLAELFTPTVWVFDLGIDGDEVQIRAVRRTLVGDDSLPANCPPGSLRRDGADGRLPLGSTARVSSRHNLVHCSDGLVAGLAEARALIPGRTSPDLLTTELTRAGLTGPEIAGLVATDPRIVVHEPNGYLSDLTHGLSLAGTVATILRAVPPVVGRANGYADGVGYAMLDRALTQGMTAAAALGVPAGSRPLATVVAPGPSDEEAGRSAIGAGIVAALVPAGGTGGRFGGYDVPETDPSRQKALVPAFTVGGRRVSALDIRLANVRYWDEGAGDRVPVAVMGSPTSADALRRWQRSLGDPYGKALRVFAQHGIYRLDRALLAGNPRNSWIDAILRDTGGRPSLKPHGGMGLFSAFMISDLLDTWERGGVAYVAVANGDDVLFRLDPRAIGHLANNPGADAVMVGIPWGYATTVERGGVPVEARGDASGWSLDETGEALAEPPPAQDRRYDRGGAVLTTDGCLSVVEGTRPDGALFNTNQLYVRLTAIRRLIDGTGTGDRAEAVGRIIARLPASLEDKTVVIDGVERPARQLSQPLHGLLSLLGRCDVITAARGAGVRGGYAPLKHPSDTRFAQLMLDARQAGGDELTLA
jgi:UTP--glucose-1-phosphate uridylyltransferase